MEFEESCVAICFYARRSHSDHLAQALESTLETWDLKKEQMVVSTTGNGANIVKAVKTNLG